MMRKISTLIVLSLLFSNAASAQFFESYLKPHLDSMERAYYNYKVGLKVLDDERNEIGRTEPIFSKAVFASGFPQAAVGIPLLSLENNEVNQWRQVWICLDYNLKPVFLFPLNTERVIKIIDGLFLYTDRPATHAYTFGLVDNKGTVLFEAPYDRIYVEKGRYVGVKNVTEKSDEPGILTWSIEIRMASMDSMSVIKLQTPEDDSCGLWGDDPDELEEDRVAFERILRESSFERGLNHVVHNRFVEAVVCFKEALNSGNPKTVRCAKSNIEALEVHLGEGN